MQDGTKQKAQQTARTTAAGEDKAKEGRGHGKEPSPEMKTAQESRTRDGVSDDKQASERNPRKREPPRSSAAE